MDWHSGGYGPSGHPPASQHHQHAYGVTGQPSFPEQQHMNKNNSGPYIGRDRLYGGIQITELYGSYSVHTWVHSGPHVTSRSRSRCPSTSRPPLMHRPATRPASRTQQHVTQVVACQRQPLPGVWALAARIVFAISPNSASCERVFSLLERLFDEEQRSSLADMIQAALMLVYNKRRVG